MRLADVKDQKTTLGFGTPARKIESGFSAFDCRTVHPAEQMKPQPGGVEPSTIPLVACLGFRALFPETCDLFPTNEADLRCRADTC